MKKENVGSIDRVIRFILGVLCVAALVYHFFISAFLPIYGIVIVIVLIPLFLKTSLTGECPIYTGFKISTKK